MYDHLPPDVKAALEENDLVRQQDDAWQAKWEARRREQQRASGEIIRKTYEPPQQQMSSAEIARLVDARVVQALMAFKKKFTEAIGYALAHERRDVHERIEKAMSAVKFPVAKAWRHGCLYEEGAVVIFGGSTFQATTATARSPGHPDWQILACNGNDGADGRDLRDSSSVTDFRKRSNA